MEMPRCCSISIQSERVERAPALPRTAPADWIAPAAASSRSVSVVLPASGCEMIAKVRRRRNGSETGRADASAAMDKDMETAEGWGAAQNTQQMPRLYGALYSLWQHSGQTAARPGKPRPCAKRAPR